jgi:protein-tyrosine-phosphatase
MYSEVRSYLEQRAKEFSQIPDERKSELQKVAEFVKSRIESDEPARLTFICTHNSRRSHMAQIWAATASSFYGIGGVETYSGGTEATAFNPRAIAAIERAGLRVQKVEEGKNPRYAVSYQNTDKPLVCFSKVYNEAPNPKENFCAVMTCTQAEKNCPNVAGSSLRVGVLFDDPKVADDTPEEAAKYDERCQQICREMLYLFSQVPAAPN